MGTGDLDISTGNLVISRDINLQVAQKLTNRFRLFRGEWFMDQRIGMPYLQQVFVKDPDLTGIAQMFRRAILDTQGVQAVLEANLNFLSGLRTLQAEFKVQTITGAILQGGLGTPFIVILDGQN